MSPPVSAFSTSHSSEPAFAVFYIATGAGLSLTVTTFTFSRISGALFSPAVSLGMALVGALTPSRAILLTCVQFLGGICAGALVNVLTPGKLQVKRPGDRERQLTQPRVREQEARITRLGSGRPCRSSAGCSLKSYSRLA